MKYEHLPNKTYSTLCAAMEEEGWISHSVACCMGEYGKERLPKLLKNSLTFSAYKAGTKPPVFDNSSARDMYLEFEDVKGVHTVPVRVNDAFVRSINGSNQKFSVAYLSDLRSGLKIRITPR